jgi:NAD(P)-dependent dehydrogenase (short-subunit alcohol dehydrogenase family)
VIGFTKCLSREAAPFGVTVNAIAAGIFDTELADMLLRSPLRNVPILGRQGAQRAA